MAAGDKFFGPFSAQGEVVGTTNVAIIVGLDFKPIKVTLYNRTQNVQAVWTQAMPSNSAQLTVTSAAGVTDLSFITTNGIIPGSAGFSIGTNAEINIDADVVYWSAERSFR